MVKYTFNLSFSKYFEFYTLLSVPRLQISAFHQHWHEFLLFQIESSSHFLVFTKGQAPTVTCVLQDAFLSPSYLQRSWKLEVILLQPSIFSQLCQEQHRRAATRTPWVSWHRDEGSAASESLYLTHSLGKVVLALGNHWHCSFLQGGMHRAGFWLDPPCWAVELLIFSSITPCLCF